MALSETEVLDLQEAKSDETWIYRCGNMAEAMLGGILKNDICAKEDVIATAKSEASRENARNTYEIQVTADNIEAAKSADVLVLAVKPIFYEEVIHEIKDAVDEKKIIISIAPGKTLAWLEEQFGKKVKLVRCMPNTPALVGEGMTRRVLQRRSVRRRDAGCAENP